MMAFALASLMLASTLATLPGPQITAEQIETLKHTWDELKPIEQDLLTEAKSQAAGGRVGPHCYVYVVAAEKDYRKAIESATLWAVTDRSMRDLQDKEALDIAAKTELADSEASIDGDRGLISQVAGTCSSSDLDTPLVDQLRANMRAGQLATHSISSAFGN